MGERAGVAIRANPADLRKLLHAARASIVPMRVGGGVQTKILESMASGLPVLCSSFANDGLGAVPGDHLAVADLPEAVVRLAQGVSQHPDEGAAMADRALSWARERHSFRAFSAAFLAACQAVAARGHTETEGQASTERSRCLQPTTVGPSCLPFWGESR
jgi:glycosyltransferase involved in cell wall biosynthesis